MVYIPLQCDELIDRDTVDPAGLSIDPSAAHGAMTAALRRTVRRCPEGRGRSGMELNSSGGLVDSWTLVMLNLWGEAVGLGNPQCRRSFLEMVIRVWLKLHAKLVVAVDRFLISRPLFLSPPPGSASETNNVCQVKFPQFQRRKPRQADARPYPPRQHHKGAGAGQG